MRTIRSIRSLLFAAILFAIPAASFAQISVGIAVGVAPPEIPVYEQPECPSDGYLWTPGYWAYGDDDYYWVPGTWVEPPSVGVLWTPGYWGWGDGGYRFHDGYWGSHIGFYGGINYGFGYTGSGYYGGRWDNGRFAYNSSVNRVNVTVIHNTYNTRVVTNNTTRVSYNGGNGGVRARETARDRQVAKERHIERTSMQTQHVQAAKADRSQFASVNKGRPAVAATPKPGAFNDRGVVHAKEAGAANARANGRVDGRTGAAANTSNTRTNASHADRPANATRSTTARTDRPGTATRPNATHETGANRADRPANATPPNTTSHAAAADRPATTHTNAPRSTSSDRPNNSARTADRAPAHTSPSKPAQQADRPARTEPTHTSRPAERPARTEKPAASHNDRPAEQHSAPRTESKPQTKDHPPHGRS